MTGKQDKRTVPLSLSAGGTAGNAGQGIAAGKEAAFEVLDTEKTASKGKPRMRMEDFTDVQSPVWNNVAYKDTETQRQIMGDTHQRMVESGDIVTIPQEIIEQMEQYYPDLRMQKKKVRNATLKEKVNELKVELRNFLTGLSRGSFEFEVNGLILDAKLYNTGIDEVMKKINQKKGSMLFRSDEIFKNAQYLYSTEDYNGNPNIYRWNYFYTPVQIGKDMVGVRIAVRDLRQMKYNQAESQIYHWGIK